MYKKLTLTLFLCGFISNSFAANIMSLSDRKDRWELAFVSTLSDAETITFNNDPDAIINIQSETSFGLDFAYNYDEHWAFGFNMIFSEPRHSGQHTNDDGDIEAFSGKLLTNSGHFTSIYHFSKRRLTPFIGVNAGFTYIDTRKPTGEIGTICNPYYFYCSPYLKTETDTKFSYGAILGLRFDINQNTFIKGGYSERWIDFDNTVGTPSISAWRFDIGIMF